MSRFRYAYLLASLCIVIFVRPFIAEQVSGVALVDVILFLTLLAGAYAAVDQKRLFAVVAALGAISLVLQVIFAVATSATWASAFLVTGFLFYVAVCWTMLRALFGEQRRVTGDTLCQAMSVYLLFGMIGAMAYSLLELSSPGSFRFAEEIADTEVRFERFLGFSFTTLTTLGYGNVAPATPRADALATSQAAIGQIYLAVVIARLVAIQVGQSSPDSTECSGDSTRSDAGAHH